MMRAAAAVELSALIHGERVTSCRPYVVFDTRRGIISEHDDLTSAVDALDHDVLAIGSTTAVYAAGDKEWIACAWR